MEVLKINDKVFLYNIMAETISEINMWCFKNAFFQHKKELASALNRERESIYLDNLEQRSLSRLLLGFPDRL